MVVCLKGAVGHFYFFSSTNVETKNVCPIAYNINIYAITRTYLTKKPMYQYYSKWRNEWIDFNPTPGQLIQLQKYFYQIRKK